MGTNTNSVISIQDILIQIPQTLREELLTSFNLITKNYRENRWEPSELNGGKLCEVVFSILRGYIDGAYPATASKPKNMVDACRSLEQSPVTFPRSVTIQIPRMLIALYEIRNNRGVGHAGSDVNPNSMDATCVLFMSKWVLAELVRIFHNVDSKMAEEIIEGIVERNVPFVWKVDDKYRVLENKTTMKEKTLMLLYVNLLPVNEQELFDWVEHSNISNYRRDVLSPLHNSKLVEYNKSTHLVTLSPKGIAFVEEIIFPKVKTT